MKRMLNSIKGFTLIELFVVIIIIGILAALVVPLYKGYTLQAMASEGQGLVAAVAAAEKVYFAQNNQCVVPANPGAANDSLGVVVTQNMYFNTYTVSNVGAAGSCSFIVTATGIVGGSAEGITITLTQNAGVAPTTTITGT